MGQYVRPKLNWVYQTADTGTKFIDGLGVKQNSKTNNENYIVGYK